MFEIVLNREPVLHTEFGIARLHRGYYRITSSKEGNKDKALHRLIFEKNNGEIPEGYDIHHKDENKLNNCISNLELISHSEHTITHNLDSKQSKETCDKISKRMVRNNNAFNPILKIGKHKNPALKQGFSYECQFTTSKGRKNIGSVKVDKCIDKVTNFILSEDNDKGYIGYSYNDVEYIVKKDS